MRTAISEAMDQLTDFLAETLKNSPKHPGIDFGDTRLIAEAMMTLVGHSGLEMAAYRVSDPADITERAIQKINFLLLGALMNEKK